MTPAALQNYLVLGAILFGLGVVGFLARRNLILMFLSAELMVLGVAINFLAFARFRGNMGGQVFALFMVTVAACEAAIALALILMLYRRRKSLDVSLWQELGEPDQEPVIDEEPLPSPPREESSPLLPVAGPAPVQPEETSHV